MLARSDEQRETAARIARDFPRWLVLYGSYTRQFVAFPLFGTARGGFVAAYDPQALVARMRVIQQQNIAPEGTADADGT
jgi:hypothetical protein